MAKQVIVVDDISGQRDAAERWAAICDGRKVYLIQIDLVDRNYSNMEKAFKDSLSRWSVSGEVTVLKLDELGAKLGIRPEVIKVDAATLQAAREKPQPTAEQAPTPTAAEKPKRTPKPKPSQRVDKHRPGVTAWHARNWQILGLPDPGNRAGGRRVKAVYDAFDRYQGKDVTQDNMLPEDLERATTPIGATDGDANP